jgi:hypothetical protein
VAPALSPARLRAPGVTSTADAASRAPGTRSPTRAVIDFGFN